MNGWFTQIYNDGLNDDLSIMSDLSVTESESGKNTINIGNHFMVIGTKNLKLVTKSTSIKPIVNRHSSDSNLEPCRIGKQLFDSLASTENADDKTKRFY